MHVRAEAVIFSVLRERESQFLFKAVASVIIYYIKGNKELWRGGHSCDHLLLATELETLFSENIARCFLFFNIAYFYN